MSNLGILIKNYCNCLLSGFRGKKKRLSTSIACVILVLLGLAIAAIYTFEAYTMFDAFKEVKLFSLPLYHGILIALTVIIIIAIMRVSGNQKSNDTDLLLSLPVKKVDIVVAKAVSKYLFDLFFVLLLFVPYLVLYQVFTKFSLAITLCGVVTTFIMPLLSVGISYVYDFIITRIFNRVKVGNLLKSLISLFVFVLIMALMMIKTFTYGLAEATSIEAYFSDRFFTNMFLQFILNQKAGATVLCLALCLGVFVLGLALFALNIGKDFVGYSGKAGNLKFSEGMGGFKRLFKKELNFFASTPAYVINTGIAPILILVVGIMLAITGMDGITSLLGVVVEKEMLVGILTLSFCFIASTAIISACSISLEGKNFWIIKTAPISENTVFFVKILLNILMVSPFIVVSSVILTISFCFSFAQFLIMCLVPVLLNVAMSVGGLLINLWLPKMDWQDPTPVVKQSMSSLITMFLGMFLAVIPVALLLSFETLSFNVLVIITASIYLLVGIIFTILLLTLGKKLYHKI